MLGSALEPQSPLHVSDSPVTIYLQGLTIDSGYSALVYRARPFLTLVLRMEGSSKGHVWNAIK